MGMHYPVPQVGERICYRCHECLAVLFGTVKERAFDGLRCPHCDGASVQYMGMVRGASVVKPKGECPCDERCQYAMGPNCDCSCGGANHGCGSLWTIEIVGNTKRLVAASENAEKDSVKFRARAALWRATWAMIDAIPFPARYTELATKRRRGHYLPAEEYAEFCVGQKLRRRIDALRYSTSLARQKKADELLAELTR